MKKSIYFVLIIVSCLMIFYTLYTSKPIIKTQLAAETAQTENTATETSTTTKTSSLITSSGKTITITELNPVGESLSTINISTLGFATDTKITLERNKLTSVLLFDMNKDNFDELVIVTTSQGSGSYGKVDIFTTKEDKELKTVDVPEIKEEDTGKDKIFEGYMGHDRFLMEENLLVREFPIYTSSSTNASSTTNQKRKISYEMKEKDGTYEIKLNKYEEKILSSSSTKNISTSSTTQEAGTSTKTNSQTPKKSI